MKFNPITKELRTDTGEFIKKLGCQYKMTWSELEPIQEGVRNCKQCNHSVTDSALYEDQELLDIIQENPNLPRNTTFAFE
jgi:hypothetical protein